ncbi:ArsR/SmtB family transcription factor [Salmonella enterica]|uniref:ArsR/SmtB family transcription factor n=1 Tax=Salmonella enterica TaxID=28901 RepID=UPI003D31CD19
MDDSLPNFSRLAYLLANLGRAKMLSSLMDSNHLTASELAYLSGLSAQSTSNHLSKLLYFKVVTFEKVGRNRYYRLYNQLVAQAIESMMAATYTDLALQQRRKPAGFKKLCYARTCYDHIAGHVGVSIFESLSKQQILITERDHLEISEKGYQWFIKELDIDIRSVPPSRRALVIPCMDWSEQSYHLSGELGSILLRCMLDRRYITKADEYRTLTITTSGLRFLQQALEIGGLLEPHE